MSAARTDAERPDDESSSLKRLAALLRPEMSRLTLVVVTLLGLAGVNMLMPLPIKLALDDIFPHSNWTLLWLTLGGLLLLYVMRNLLFYFSKQPAVEIGENVCFNLRNRLFHRLQHMNLEYYRRTGPGQLTSRVMNDCLTIQLFIQDEMSNLLRSLFLFLALVAGLYAVNWQLALAATIVLPLHLMAYRKYRGPIRESSGVAQEQLALVQGNLLEKFLGVEVVKGFTGEQREREAFSRATDLSRESQLRSKTYHVLQKIVGDLLVGAGTIALLGFGALQVMGSKMDTGTFALFLGWVGMLYPTVLELMSGLAKLTKSAASMDRVYELLDSGKPEGGRLGASDTPVHGRLKFEGVCFAYEHGSPVLRQVNIDVPAGRVCAIVGPSGAGKTTLVSMVPRFIEPTMGRIMLDGQDMQKVELHHLRTYVGIAFQECFLFNATILENIKYANPTATMNEIVEIARRTGSDDFIARLPDGYDTIVGESGVTLSRGQKQRINLTRAMLKKPKILVMDEATASIDTASEAQIIPNILDFMQGRTVMMITHRPELLKHADMAVRLEQGRVSYAGPADGLDLVAQMRATSDEDGAERPAAEPAVNATAVDDIIPPASSTPPPPRRDLWNTANVWIAGVLAAIAMTLGPTPVWAQEEAAAAETAAEEVPPAEAEAVEEAADDDDLMTGRLLAQPDLSEREVEEMLRVVVGRAKVELGYKLLSPDAGHGLADPPVRIRNLMVLGRTNGVRIDLIQLGYEVYESQPIQLWLFGQTVNGANPPGANADVATLITFLHQARATRDAKLADMKPSDMASEKIRLSYIAPDRCLHVLNLLGYTVVPLVDGTEPQRTLITADKLPVVAALPPPKDDKTALQSAKNANLLPTEADPANELMVFYHPARPEQFSQVRDRIRNQIDVPARRVLIEVMVLEISDIGLERLGIEWELESPGHNIEAVRLGRLPVFATATDEVPTLDVKLSDVFGEFSAEIQALIRDGSAEVLSRPSVVATNNRMANFSVEERIPVVSGISTKDGNVTVAFGATIVAGITLNVRPRISHDDKEVAMTIVTEISARVPGGDVVVRDSGGTELARSPTISARKVVTYPRIPNNTPLIIGGLISKDDQRELDKVPLLGDVPLFGWIFQSRRRTSERREVIIVITPYVLPEETTISPVMPEDKDVFDTIDAKLFRDRIRIRAEDVFDLSFLYENQQLVKMQRLADKIAARNIELARQYPVNRFADDRIPGEQIIVYRQMYEVIKRRRMDDRITNENILLFAPDEQTPSKFRIMGAGEFLSWKLGLDYPATEQDIRDAMKDKAVALTYTLRDREIESHDIFAQPVPHIAILDCANDQNYSNLLWTLNQPDREGRQRYTILIHSESDMKRLRRAIVLKRTVELNATAKAPTLRNFSLGKQLLMPTIVPDRKHVIDEETAKYFFFVEQYYAAWRDILARDIEAMQRVLALPDYQRYLDHPDEARRMLQWQPRE